MCVCFRRFPILLGAVLHVQHPGRDLQQTGQTMLARRPNVHTDHVAGLHEQLRQPGHLHDIQPGVPEGVQETDADRHLTRGRRQELRLESLRQLNARVIIRKHILYVYIYIINYYVTIIITVAVNYDRYGRVF